jgi:hypothetical protein
MQTKSTLFVSVWFLLLKGSHGVTGRLMIPTMTKWQDDMQPLQEFKPWLMESDENIDITRELLKF